MRSASLGEGRPIEAAVLEKGQRLPDGLVVVHDEHVIGLDGEEVTHPGQSGFVDAHGAVMRSCRSHQRRVVRRWLQRMKPAGARDHAELATGRPQLAVERSGTLGAQIVERFPYSPRAHAN